MGNGKAPDLAGLGLAGTGFDDDLTKALEGIGRVVPASEPIHMDVPLGCDPETCDPITFTELADTNKTTSIRIAEFFGLIPYVYNKHKWLENLSSVYPSVVKERLRSALEYFRNIHFEPSQWKDHAVEIGINVDDVDYNSIEKFSTVLLKKLYELFNYKIWSRDITMLDDDDPATDYTNIRSLYLSRIKRALAPLLRNKKFFAFMIKFLNSYGVQQILEKGPRGFYNIEREYCASCEGIMYKFPRTYSSQMIPVSLILGGKYDAPLNLLNSSLANVLTVDDFIFCWDNYDMRNVGDLVFGSHDIPELYYNLTGTSIINLRSVGLRFNAENNIFEYGPHRIDLVDSVYQVDCVYDLPDDPEEISYRCVQNVTHLYGLLKDHNDDILNRDISFSTEDGESILDKQTKADIVNAFITFTTNSGLLYTTVGYEDIRMLRNEKGIKPTTANLIKFLQRIDSMQSISSYMSVKDYKELLKRKKEEARRKKEREIRAAEIRREKEAAEERKQERSKYYNDFINDSFIKSEAIERKELNRSINKLKTELKLLQEEYDLSLIRDDSESICEKLMQNISDIEAQLEKVQSIKKQLYPPKKRKKQPKTVEPPKTVKRRYTNQAIKWKTEATENNTHDDKWWESYRPSNTVQNKELAPSSYDPITNAKQKKKIRDAAGVKSARIDTYELNDDIASQLNSLISPLPFSEMYYIPHRAFPMRWWEEFDYDTADDRHDPTFMDQWIIGRKK